jgi:hypothetical protein
VYTPGLLETYRFDFDPLIIHGMCLPARLTSTTILQLADSTLVERGSRIYAPYCNMASAIVDCLYSFAYQGARFRCRGCPQLFDPDIPEESL